MGRAVAWPGMMPFPASMMTHVCLDFWLRIRNLPFSPWLREKKSLTAHSLCCVGALQVQRSLNCAFKPWFEEFVVPTSPAMLVRIITPRDNAMISEYYAGTEAQP